MMGWRRPSLEENLAAVQTILLSLERPPGDHPHSAQIDAGIDEIRESAAGAGMSLKASRRALKAVERGADELLRDHGWPNR